MNNPLVSVIIPTYARPTNLVRAIDSVLNQTYHPIEIIVVDDNGLGSDFQRETKQLLSSYINKKEILYIPHDVNKNGSAARNTGVSVASGKYICLLDDDDEYLPNKIQSQVGTLELHTCTEEEIGGCYCNYRHIGYHRDIEKINPKPQNIIEDILLSKIEFNSSTLMIKANVYKELCGFDERYKRHQDLEFYMRFLQKYKFVCAYPEGVLLQKYQTPNVVTRNPYKSIEYLEFFIKNNKKWIDILPHKNAIYSHLYSKLACILIRGKNWKEGFSYIFKAGSYKFPTRGDMMHFIYSFFVNK